MIQHMDERTTDPRDELVEEDGRIVRRGDTPAYQRLHEESMAFDVEWPDGTKMVAGRLVHIGPRAILTDDGADVIGMRPE